MSERPSDPLPPPPPSAGFSLPPPSGAAVPDVLTGRFFSLVLAAITAVSVIGFMTGIERGNERHVTPRPYASTEAPAPGYVDLRSLRRGPNAHLYEHAFEALELALPSPLEPVPPQSAEERARVLASRSERRAYDGAPPVIPHAIRADGAFECLSCHERGAMVAGKRAPAMSHERHDNCTQCHAPPSGLPAPSAPVLTDNTFVGSAPAASGERAWLGAPPTIPHSTWMRSQCGSCHGVAGALGMRTPHPERQSCTQCHAPAATLDQRPPAQPGFQ